jgi:Tol biopolymer transport system component
MVGNDVDVYTVDVASGAATRRTTSRGEDRDPSWSPDGTQLAFSSARDGTPRVFVMNADGTGQRRLTRDGFSGEAPQWSPDGRAIAFVSDRDGARELYAINVDGQGLARLAAGIRVTRDPPLWSPDSARIVFQMLDGRNYDIGVVRLSDKALTLVAQSPSYDGSYAWSPDGTRIAFISGRDGFDAVYAVDADGRHEIQLSSSPSLTPAWTAGAAPVRIEPLGR